MIVCVGLCIRFCVFSPTHSHPQHTILRPCHDASWSPLLQLFERCSPFQIHTERLFMFFCLLLTHLSQRNGNIFLSVLCDLPAPYSRGKAGESSTPLSVSHRLPVSESSTPLMVQNGESWLLH